MLPGLESHPIQQALALLRASQSTAVDLGLLQTSPISSGLSRCRRGARLLRKQETHLVVEQGLPAVIGERSNEARFQLSAAAQLSKARSPMKT